MATRKTTPVYVTFDRRKYTQVNILTDINEVELKAQLRDLGYISSYQSTYLTTKVYLESDDKQELKEICTDEYRSIEELGIKNNSLIYIQEGEPEPSRREVAHEYEDIYSMRCLYGCPMARSVEDAINQAEKYTEEDSRITTGSIDLT